MAAIARPTLTELLAMDWALLEAFAERLVPQAAAQASFFQLFGGRR